MSPINQITQELAIIDTVNTDRWTVDVTTLLSNKSIKDVQISGLLANANNGAMMGAVPEVGAIGYINMAASRNEYAMTTFVMPFSRAESFKGGRPQLNAGDILLRSNSGNQILIRKGDIITISAGTGLAMRTFTGKTNTIKDICGSYQLETAGGNISWGKNNLLPLATGTSPTCLTVEVKTTDILEPTITIDIGTIVDEIMQQIRVKIMDIKTGNDVYKLTVDTIGNAVETAVSKKIESTGIGSLGNIEILVSGIGTPNEDMPKIKLGVSNSSTFSPAILGSFLAVDGPYATHTHTGLAVGPPVFQYLDPYLSTSVEVGD
jgi:hypothetical protein